MFGSFEKICFGVFVLWLWSCIWFCTNLETYDLVRSIEEDYLFFSCKLSDIFFRFKSLEWIVVSSANSSQRAFKNKGRSFFVERTQKRALTLTLCGTPYFKGTKTGFNCVLALT